MYSSSPLVTVLMSVYNGEKYFPETIESILNQTFTNFEFLIIDDGSSDNSIKIIESYDDPRIRLICNDENIGQTKTLNKGIKLAKGNFIARSDQDDISSSNRLFIQYNYLNNNPNFCLIHSKEINHTLNSSLNIRMNKAISRVKYVVANSRYTKQLGVDVGLDEKKIHIIHPGTNYPVPINEKCKRELPEKWHN